VHHHHHWIFAALSVAVAIMGSWTALDLFQRIRAQSGRARLTWLAVASLAMGSSIWSMHFIAMLGFDPGSPVSYDPLLTTVSLVLAVGGTAGAFFTAALGGGGAGRLVGSGAAMGLAICAMHYVGMAALKTAASLGYRPGLVLLSLVIAVGASTAALWGARRERSMAWRAGAALVLGVAISGMHYTAMAALVLTPTAGAMEALPGAPPLMLAVAVAAGTAVILFIALAASLYDQRQALLEVLNAGGVGYWEFYPRTRHLGASERTKIIVGLAPDAPVDEAAWRAMLTPEAQADRDALLAEALSTGRDYTAEYQLHDGRWVSLRGRVLKDRIGRPLKIAGVLLDVTDRRRAFAEVAESERRQRLLINELNHRVKNTLATILAIASMTARRATSVEDFVSAFQARLIALSTTHNLLTAQGWEKAELQRLLEEEFRPYADEQVKLEGPPVWIPAEQALALGLVLHELATNAAKYGALSTPDGCVQVAWTLQGENLTIDWRERGGPRVTAPEQTGFGSRLIRTSVEGGLKGTLAVQYAPGGIEIRMAFTLQRSAPQA
jgi:NO-binding membrane sensor protein with MHYT domain/two-component sensor histidine kinase